MDVQGERVEEGWGQLSFPFTLSQRWKWLTASEQARRVRGAANRIPPAFSMQVYNSANQLVAAEIENGPAGREREKNSP